MTKKKWLVLRKGDNVALALADLEPGERLQVGAAKVVVRQPIEFGHKFAVRAVGKGEDILKHGEVIGRATERIDAGKHVHVHNVESLRARRG